MIISPQHPLLALSIDFCELCKPLEQFGLHHITFQKQYNNGSRIALSNKPGWVADYYNLELYDTSLFEKPAEIYQPEHKIWLGEFDLPVYQHGKNYYNSTCSITITEPQKDGCEFYFSLHRLKMKKRYIFWAITWIFCIILFCIGETAVANC